MDTCMYMTESLFWASEDIATLLISYTPMENRKLKKITTHAVDPYYSL